MFLPSGRYKDDKISQARQDEALQHAGVERLRNLLQLPVLILRFFIRQYAEEENPLLAEVLQILKTGHVVLEDLNRVGLTEITPLEKIESINMYSDNLCARTGPDPFTQSGRLEGWNLMASTVRALKDYYIDLHNITLTDASIFTLMRIDEVETITEPLRVMVAGQQDLSAERIRVMAAICRWSFGMRLKYLNHEAGAKDVRKSGRYSVKVISQWSRPPFISDKTSGFIVTYQTLMIRDWFPCPFDYTSLTRGCGPIPFNTQAIQAAGYEGILRGKADFLRDAQDRDRLIASQAFDVVVKAREITPDEAIELITLSPYTWCREGAKESTEGMELMLHLIAEVRDRAPHAAIAQRFLWMTLNGYFDKSRGKEPGRNLTAKQWDQLKELRKKRRFNPPEVLREAFPGWRLEKLYGMRKPSSANREERQNDDDSREPNESDIDDEDEDAFE